MKCRVCGKTLTKKDRSVVNCFAVIVGSKNMDMDICPKCLQK